MKETQYLKSHPYIIYDVLYEIQEFESFREQAKKYFKEKYGIDYFTMHTLNQDRSLLFFRMDNDKWHECLQIHKWNMNYFPLLVNNIDTIQPNELYIEYFDTFMLTEEVKIRAEVFGERKYGGCEILMTNENNDIIMYSITFKDDKALEELLRNVLNELVKDLIRYRNLLTPFARYGEMGGDFQDKILLNKHLNQFKNENRDIFYIK